MKVNKEALHALVTADTNRWRAFSVSMSRAYKYGRTEPPPSCAAVFPELPPQATWLQIKAKLISARKQNHQPIVAAHNKRKMYMRDYMKTYMRIKRQKLRTVSNVV